MNHDEFVGQFSIAPICHRAAMRNGSFARPSRPSANVCRARPRSTSRRNCRRSSGDTSRIAPSSTSPCTTSTPGLPSANRTTSGRRASMRGVYSTRSAARFHRAPCRGSACSCRSSSSPCSACLARSSSGRHCEPESSEGPREHESRRSRRKPSAPRDAITPSRDRVHRWM
jgi:hypothetical protein